MGKKQKDGRLSAAKRGYGHKWRKARKVFLDKEENALCRYCVNEGRTKEANVVDHIIPHKGCEILFWDETNWQPLCVNCHNSRKKMEELSGRVKKSFGDDGWPV